MNESERYEALRHCRYVDEIIRDAPWVLDVGFLEKHKVCDCNIYHLPSDTDILYIYTNIQTGSERKHCSLCHSHSMPILFSHSFASLTSHTLDIALHHSCHHVFGHSSSVPHANIGL